MSNVPIPTAGILEINFLIILWHYLFLLKAKTGVARCYAAAWASRRGAVAKNRRRYRRPAVVPPARRRSRAATPPHPGAAWSSSPRPRPTSSTATRTRRRKGGWERGRWSPRGWWAWRRACASCSVGRVSSRWWVGASPAQLHSGRPSMIVSWAPETSVLDPNTLNLDPDQEFWSNWDPDQSYVIN